MVVYAFEVTRSRLKCAVHFLFFYVSLVFSYLRDEFTHRLPLSSHHLLDLCTIIKTIQLMDMVPSLLYIGLGISQKTLMFCNLRPGET